MSLTRKALVAMGIEAEKIDQIIEMHTEVVDSIKLDRDAAKEDAKKYKADSETLVKVQKELDDLKAKEGQPDSYKEKYENLKNEFDAFKNEQSAKETKAAKTEAYKDMLKEIGISGKRLDSIARLTDLDSIELVDGKIKDIEELKTKAKDEWSDFIVSEGTMGAKTPTPPASTGGKMSKEDILNIKDTSQRQAAIANNLDLFKH